MDDALVRHYGVDRLGIYNMWRASVGAPPYEPPVLSEALPTAIPLPTVLPYSLTPQPQATGIEAKGATPTPSPGPSPTHTATPEAVAVVTGPEATATPEPAEVAPSAGCGAPLEGGPGAVDMSSFALLAGLAGLGLRRRLKR